MAFNILKTTPKLAPYFAFIGIGTTMAVSFASWRLTTGPDVVINKQFRSDPWNDVEQGTNTKLYTRRPEWWAAREDMPHPQAAFREDKGESAITRALAAKRKLKRQDEAAKMDAAVHSITN